MADAPIELPQGTLDLLILKTVALGPQHGWAISERVRRWKWGIEQPGGVKYRYGIAQKVAMTATRIFCRTRLSSRWGVSRTLPQTSAITGCD